MDFLNIENLKNFDIERVAQHVAGALDEYPDRSKSDKVIVTSGGAQYNSLVGGEKSVLTCLKLGTCSCKQSKSRSWSMGGAGL